MPMARSLFEFPEKRCRAQKNERNRRKNNNNKRPREEMRFVKETLIKASVDKVFGFHLRPDVLERLMPPWEKADIIQPPSGLEVGTRVIFNVWLMGLVPSQWVAEHTAYDPPHMFEDTQVSGPFSSWRHRHMFIEHEEGTVLRDEIDFEPPLGFLGELVAPFLIVPNIQRMFDHRHDVTKQFCEEPDDPSA